jgi:predicted alpha/beta superfamily hydrolase
MWCWDCCGVCSFCTDDETPEGLTGAGGAPLSRAMIALRTLLAAFVVAALTAAAQAAPPPAPAPTPLPDGRPIVIGQSYLLVSAVLRDERRVNVYLPPDYCDQARRFPVLYLLDGGESEDFHHITGIVQVSGAYGATQEMIVVGIEGKDRKHDLTAPSADPGDVKLLPTSGGAAAYRRFLVEELKPWVAAHYRVSGHSALIGESLAGLFTLETFLTAPRSFDDYIAVSPSLWWNNGALSREAEFDLKAGNFAGRRLWLAAGDEGGTMQQGLDRVRAALASVKPTGLLWTYDPRPTERHDSIYHPVAMTAIRTLYAVGRP